MSCIEQRRLSCSFYETLSYVPQLFLLFSATDSLPISSTISGIAPGAQLTVFDMGDSNGDLSPPSDYYHSLLLPSYASGAKISTHAWGFNDYFYSEDAIAIDTFAYDYPDALIVVSAGNDANEGSGASYTGDQSIGRPGVCKNVITVGAAENHLKPSTVAYFSSRGPTLDQRIKPDLVAPGEGVTT